MGTGESGCTSRSMVASLRRSVILSCYTLTPYTTCQEPLTETGNWSHPRPPPMMARQPPGAVPMPRERDVRVHLLPTLAPPGSLTGGVAVVIDVLRATTTIVHALAAGCEA